MENDLILFEKLEGPPQKKMEDDLKKKLKIEDDLKKMKTTKKNKMENNL